MTNTKNVTLMTPFIVKNAMSRRFQSRDETSECSYASSAATAATPAVEVRSTSAPSTTGRAPAAANAAISSSARPPSGPTTTTIRPDAGTIELLGRPFGGRDRHRLFEVGALIESPSFYPYLSGRENLRALAAAGAPVQSAALAAWGVGIGAATACAIALVSATT